MPLFAFRDWVSSVRPIAANASRKSSLLLRAGVSVVFALILISLYSDRAPKVAAQDAG